MNKKLLKFILFILIIIVLLISTCTVSNGYNKIDKGATVTQRQEQDKQVNGQNENIEKEALNNRRSVRQFKSVDLKLEDISQILWAAQGITEISTGFRTAPSAGALYPLELFIVKSDGLFHYVPEGHKLKKLSSSDLRSELMKASLSQKSVSEAPVDIVITAIFERTTVKYGDRGVRYIYMEAGHACQNILIEAVVSELGAVPIGAFSDTDVQKVLGLPKDYTPLYVVPVGYIK
jgi:SagB-type dehydrogenase family enzyme